MERFVRRKNIERYRKLLTETTDEGERRLIAKLLKAEEAREAAENGGVGGTTQNP